MAAAAPATVAAAGQGEEYPGRLTLYVFLTCAVAATGGLILGYDIGISGGVTSMDTFLQEFFPSVYRKEHAARGGGSQYCKFDSQLLTAFTSSLYLAALVASFFVASVARSLGRRWSMFGGGVSFLAGAALNAAARNVDTILRRRGRQIIIGTLIGVKFGDDDGAISKAYAAAVVAFICVYVAGFAWSWGPLGILVPSELFPLGIRPAGQAINVAVNMLCTFAVAQAFLPMLCRLRFGLFYFFGGWVLAMTLFVAAFLPETKGVPIEKMGAVWRTHWFWRRFVADEDDGRAGERDVEMDYRKANGIVFG